MEHPNQPTRQTGSGDDLVDLIFTGFFGFLAYRAWTTAVRPRLVEWLTEHGLTPAQIHLSGLPSGSLLDWAAVIVGVALVGSALLWRRRARRRDRARMSA